MTLSIVPPNLEALASSCVFMWAAANLIFSQTVWNTALFKVFWRPMTEICAATARPSPRNHLQFLPPLRPQTFPPQTQPTFLRSNPHWIPRQNRRTFLPFPLPFIPPFCRPLLPLRDLFFVWIRDAPTMILFTCVGMVKPVVRHRMMRIF